MSTAVPGETPELLTIGELARWVNVAPSTLRHYEDLGLLDAVSEGTGRRRYDRAAVGIAAAVLLLQDVGFTVRETQELLDARSGSPRSWRQMAEHKIAALDRQIAVAGLARAALDHALRCEHEGIVGCPDFQAIVADHLAGRAVDRDADVGSAADAFLPPAERADSEARPVRPERPVAAEPAAKSCKPRT